MANVSLIIDVNNKETGSLTSFSESVSKEVSKIRICQHLNSEFNTVGLPWHISSVEYAISQNDSVLMTPSIFTFICSFVADGINKNGEILCLKLSILHNPYFQVRIACVSYRSLSVTW